MKHWVACGLMISVVAGAPAATLTAAQVVEKNIAARGGLDAWRAVASLTLAGEMDAGGKQNVKLPFVLTMKRPHKSRLEIRFRDQPALQVYDGKQGWKFRPYLARNEIEPYSPSELRSAAAAAELDGPLVDFARKGTAIELQGTELVEGRAAYKLRLSIKGSAAPLNLWVDAANFLEVKVDGEPRKLDGRMRTVAVYYRDYKAEGKLQVPHTLETTVEGDKRTYKMTVQSVKVNSPVDDLLFGKPQLAMMAPPAR